MREPHHRPTFPSRSPIGRLGWCQEGSLLRHAQTKPALPSARKQQGRRGRRAGKGEK
ncbi:hypothetical protein E2C01_072298 [Portunus trituberculatus]|uniref:Uncharacterized protein n=1 Tax=Portunus trituberculatus TaxID=210409 RepID=A0A5B7HXL3_PORTR|nr:hypothetical protein [Portunus trituberculatus]